MTRRYYAAACVRCGIERKGGKTHTSPLCRDCKLALTPAERELWTKDERTAA